MGEETPTRVVGYHRAGSMQAKEARKWEWGEMRQLRWVAVTWSDGRQDGESVRCLGYGLDGIYSANQVSRHAVFVQPETPLELSWTGFLDAIQTPVRSQGERLCRA